MQQGAENTNLSQWWVENTTEFLQTFAGDSCCTQDWLFLSNQLTVLFTNFIADHDSLPYINKFVDQQVQNKCTIKMQNIVCCSQTVLILVCALQSFAMSCQKWILTDNVFCIVFFLSIKYCSHQPPKASSQVLEHMLYHICTFLHYPLGLNN